MVTVLSPHTISELKPNTYILEFFPYNNGVLELFSLDQVLQQHINDHFPPPHMTVKNEEYITFFQVLCLHVVTLQQKAPCQNNSNYIILQRVR
jgi:hypothetical protein